jgi:hypothetical protein
VYFDQIALSISRRLLASGSGILASLANRGICQDMCVEIHRGSCGGSEPQLTEMELGVTGRNLGHSCHGLLRALNSCSHFAYPYGGNFGARSAVQYANMYRPNRPLAKRLAMPSPTPVHLAWVLFTSSRTMDDPLRRTGWLQSSSSSSWLFLPPLGSLVARSQSFSPSTQFF